MVITGAVVATRISRIPTALYGFACTMATAMLWQLNPRALEHCIVVHRSVEPGYGRQQEVIGGEPLFDFGVRLSEDSDATLALSMPWAAVECYIGMANSPDAGLSGLT